MKKIFLIVMAICTVLLTGCEKLVGNELVKVPENTSGALSVYRYNGDKMVKGEISDEAVQAEIFVSLASVPAEKAEDWSAADVKFPVYGVKFGFGEDNFEAAWSDGYWITKTGEAYRFKYDFDALWEAHEWENKSYGYTMGSVLPCSYYLCRGENGWTAKYLQAAKELPEMPDTLSVTSKLDGNALTVEFTNNGEREWSFGESFIIQVQLDGIWYNIPTLPGDWEYIALGYLVMPQQTLEHEYDLSCYGELPEGKYRLVTDCFWTEFYIGNGAETVQKSRDGNGEWIAESLEPAGALPAMEGLSAIVAAQDEKSLTVRLTNWGYGIGAEDFRYGEPFHVEVFLGKRWYIVPTKDIEFAFPMPLYTLSEGETRELNYNFFMYAPFPEGRYRVVNDGGFWVEFTAGEKITPKNDLAKDAVRNFHVIYYEDGREMRADIDKSKEVGEFLNIVSANPAEKAADWSAERVTSPIFGIKATDAQGWTVEGVWSNGYWISNRHNDVYRLDLDMDMLKKKIVQCEQKSITSDVPIAWLPCGTYLCRDKDGGWIAERLSDRLWELPEPPENVTAEIVENTGNSVAVRYTNNGEKEWVYGNGYSLEVQLDGEWYDVPEMPGNWGFTTEGIILPAGESCFKDCDFFMYGDLPAGRYRIIANDFVLEFDLDTENTLFHRDG